MAQVFVNQGCAREKYSQPVIARDGYCAQHSLPLPARESSIGQSEEKAEDEEEEEDNMQPEHV